MRSVVILNHRQILLSWLNEGGLDVWGMWHIGGRREMDRDFGLENLNKKKQGKLICRRDDNIKMDLI